MLQWISDGCPEGVWRDFTYKTTAYALAARGLVNIDRRRDQWSASITGVGEFYLAHGQYPSDATLVTEEYTPSQAGSGSEDLAAQILKELTSGDGKLTVASPSERERARYRRAIHCLIVGHVIPEGFVLRHTGRDHGDLTIRVIREAEEPRPQPAPEVVVPQTASAVSDDLRALGSEVLVAVTEPSMERALRILQAIANECASRGWTLDRESRDTRGFRIRTSECSFELSLSEELVDREVPDEEKLDASKYTWQRIPLHVRKVGSGRLTLQLGQYWQRKSWSDRRRWTLDDKLGTAFVELDRRVAEAAEQRQWRAADLLRRQQDWDAAVHVAQQAYVVDLNRRRLRAQVAHRAEAEALRDYARTLEALIDERAEPSTTDLIVRWGKWAVEEADRIDPLNNPDCLRYLEPDTLRAEDYDSFMPKGMSAHRRPRK